MKAFTLLATLVLAVTFNTALFAMPSDADAEKAFAESALVKSAIAKLKTQGFTREEPVESVVLGGGCGFAGCDATILVVQRLSTEGANTRTRSTLGLVNVPTVGAATFQKLVTLK
jgi:hypothetical protein